MADSDVGVIDRKTFNLIAAVVRAEMGAVKNRLVSETVDSAPPSVQPRWVPFVNTTSETIPAYAIMAISTGSDFDADAGQSLLKVSKPSTTFCRMYAVNSSVDSTALGGGVCYLSGPVQVLYEGSFTPTSTNSGGPKPDSWAVNEGWPTAINFFGTVNTTTKIAHGFLRPITSVVAKTSSAIAALTTANVAGTGTAVIWTNVGSTFAESSPKQSFTGTNFSTVASTTTDLYGFTERDGVMCMDAPASAGGGGGGTKLFKAALTATLNSTSTSASIGSVVSWTTDAAPSPTSAVNFMSLAGQSGDLALIAEDVSSGTTTYTYRLINVQHHVCST